MLKNSFVFYIKTKDRTIKLPVPPPSIKVNFGSMNKTVNLLNFGELNLIGENKLREWSISSFFPRRNHSYCKCKPLHPSWYCKFIDNIIYNKEVIRIIVPGTRLNNACTIESFEWSIQDGSRDVYYTITFKEHKVVGKEKLVVI